MNMTATVLSVNPRGLLVRDSATGQDIFVNFTNPGAFAPGDIVRITYTGTMTPSIPPQISATSIVRVTLPPVQPPTPGPSFSEIRGATILQIRRGAMLVRDPSRNNRQVTISYAYAHHFCVGQRVNIQYETAFLGEQGQLTLVATDVSPTC